MGRGIVCVEKEVDGKRKKSGSCNTKIVEKQITKKQRQMRKKQRIEGINERS